ncbi:hypothetical protein B4110_0363 [Parageobacillus toebii]|uniref:ABC transmembrane type-1 domain-containing protein n=1 Tax=Parageobacillus toebii TaxID=153151 RepID=A0A150MAD8_9BACL|nr:hypothetical protein B4110_0363 [Parageobacillus toebii]
MAKSTVFFKAAIYFFYAVPLIFVTYLYLVALHANQTFFTPVIREPIITIMFVIAMLNPFFAILTKVAVNDLELTFRTLSTKIGRIFSFRCRMNP